MFKDALEEDEAKICNNKFLHRRYHAVILVISFHPEEDAQGLNCCELFLHHFQNDQIQIFDDEFISYFIYFDQAIDS